MSKITPTVGRVVHYRPRAGVEGEPRPALAALVAAVHSDECVNLTVSDPNGATFPAQFVYHVDSAGPPNLIEGAEFDSWEWMPYQLGQAAKNDGELEEVKRAQVALGVSITELGDLVAQLQAEPPGKKAIAAEVAKQLDAALERLQTAAAPPAG